MTHNPICGGTFAGAVPDNPLTRKRRRIMPLDNARKSHSKFTVAVPDNPKNLWPFAKVNET